ncbi:MAG: hypothetical protein J6U53_02545 [Tidjanibacter sp.]|nr:hypothetical protein [Tidjanibacter sp.]
MSNSRNRATGWQHAKLSGHANETNVENLFKDTHFCELFSKRLGIKKIVSAKVGGLCETNVTSVLGDKTKSKTDLKLTLEDGNVVNISIKKSNDGQVFLIGVERFIAGYELQFKESIPDHIQDLLYLYFYGNPKTQTLLNDSTVTRNQKASWIKYQRKHNRLTWVSLFNMNKNSAEALLDWLKNNIEKITDFCFSRGLAKNPSDWAQYVWYINLLDEDSLNTVFSIEDIKRAVVGNKNTVSPSSRCGGSTTHLPFGFVQWHQAKMQFHLSLNKLSDIVMSKF